MPTNSDFDKYVNSLNEITNQENRAELESFYTLHSAVLQFFKAIDKVVQDALNKANVGTIVLKQLETVLPILTKLKKEIAALDTEEIANGYKTKINQSITFIKNKMTLSEVNDTARQCFDLLKENKDTILVETKEKGKNIKKINNGIKEALQRLTKTQGFLIISTKDCYVQFLDDLDKRQLCFEALSSDYEPAIGNKDKEFKQFSFRHDKGTNYYKYIPFANLSVDQTVQEIKTIFETIYHVDYSTCKIESNFDEDNPANKANAYIEQAISLVQSKKYTEALHYSDQAIKLDSNVANYWDWKSFILFELRRYTESLYDCEQALNLGSTNAANIWNRKALIFHSLGKYEDYIFCAEQAIKFDSNFADAWHNKGCGLAWLKRYGEALYYFDQAIKLNSNVAIYWDCKAWSLGELGRYKEAIISSNQAIKLEPNNDGYRNRYTTLQGYTQQPEQQSNSSGCFVATACFGDYDAPEVLVLRQYRDNTLLHTYWGRFFVKFYYFVSPPIARQIEKSDRVKTFMRRHLLNPIIKKIKKYE
jgi:tetratricopeptide (TPR) repeat protein